MNERFTREDKQAGCLSLVMLGIALFTIVIAFFNDGRQSFLYNLALILGMALPFVFPILAIVMVQRVSRVGAGILLLTIIFMMLLLAVVWVILANNLVSSQIAEGLAIELTGSVFTALAIVLIERTISKFTEEDEK